LGEEVFNVLLGRQDDDQGGYWTTQVDMPLIGVGVLDVGIYPLARQVCKRGF